MKSISLLALIFSSGMSLFSHQAEAQVTLNGPLRAMDALNGGKPIDIPAGKSVLFKNFEKKSGNPTGDVFFNIAQRKSQAGSDGNEYFVGDFSGKTIYLSRDAMIQALSTPTADPKVAVDRLTNMNKATGKGPNGIPPCASCSHLAGKELEGFEAISKSDEELRKYTCLFHKHTHATGIGDRNFEMTLPVMKEASKATGIPVAYISCIIQQESQYEIFNGAGHYGLGHFGNSTAGAVAADALEVGRSIAAKKGYPARTVSQVKSMILMNDGRQLTEEIAIYQSAAIAANARRLLEDFGLSHLSAQQSAATGDGNAFLNTLLLAAAGHNVGSGIITSIPYSAFGSNSTSWTDRGNIPGTTRVYLQNMKMCMEKGNFNARDNGTWKPDHARCGG